MDGNEQLSRLILCMKNGLPPKHLVKEEIDILKRQFGNDWFHEMGYRNETDLPEVSNEPVDSTLNVITINEVDNETQYYLVNRNEMTEGNSEKKTEEVNTEVRTTAVITEEPIKTNQWKGELNQSGNGRSWIWRPVVINFRDKKYSTWRSLTPRLYHPTYTHALKYGKKYEVGH